MLWKIEREKNAGAYTVYFDGSSLGRIETYRNPFHSQSCYLRFYLERYEGLAARELFDLLWEAEKRPLQAMLSSGEERLTDFLLAGGFERKRRCWELEVKKRTSAPLA